MPATATEIRTLLRLSAPVVVTQVALMMLGVVDTIMVGWYGTGEVSVEALGAASLGNLWVVGTYIVAMGILCGMDPIVTQAEGRRDVRMLGLSLQRGIVLSLAISVPLAFLWLVTEPVLVACGQSPALAKPAGDYVRVQIPCIPFFLGFTALRQYLQGRGIVVPAMVVAIAANGINVLGNWVLIHGNLGAPALGVVGAGIATSLTRVFLLVALVWITMRGRLCRDGWVPWTREALRFEGLVDILRHGVSVGAQFGLEVWAFQIATLWAGKLGTVELAAHTIVLNLASLSFMLPLGVSMGAVTRVGNLIGERRRFRAQRAAWIAFALGAGIMVICAVVFSTLRTLLPAAYTSSPEVQAAAAAVLPIAAAFQIFDGTQVVGCSILRGMGRTVPAALINVLGYYALALPLAFWLTWGAGWGLAGIWWGLALGLLVVAALLLAWIWRRGPARMRPGRPSPLF